LVIFARCNYDGHEDESGESNMLWFTLCVTCLLNIMALEKQTC